MYQAMLASSVYKGRCIFRKSLFYICIGCLTVIGVTACNDAQRSELSDPVSNKAVETEQVKKSVTTDKNAPSSQSPSSNNVPDTKGPLATRIIIHFSNALDSSEKKSVTDVLKRNGINNVDLADSSNETRWVLILSSDYPKESITELCNDLKLLASVSAAEQDRLMSFR